MGQFNVTAFLGESMEHDVFFNELCLNNSISEYSVIENFIDCYKKLKENGFTKCRADHETKEKILNYLLGLPGGTNRNLKYFLYSFLASPFEKDNITEDKEEKYITHKLLFEENTANGALWAYTYNTFLCSLLTNEKWNTPELTFKDEPTNEDITLHHCSTSENIEIQTTWIETLKDVELVKTKLNPNYKKVHLRDDHGKDKLKTFWNKIKNSEYVESCINSLPFNSFDKTLIHNIYSNGQIELVLYWEEKGIGMIIQTTGRNFRETKKIADILESRYSQ